MPSPGTRTGIPARMRGTCSFMPPPGEERQHAALDAERVGGAHDRGRAPHPGQQPRHPLLAGALARAVRVAGRRQRVVLAHREVRQRVAVSVDRAHQHVMRGVRQQRHQFLHPLRLEADEVHHRIRPEVVQRRLQIGRAAAVAAVEPHRVREPGIGTLAALEDRQRMPAGDQFLGAAAGDVPRPADQQDPAHRGLSVPSPTSATGRATGAPCRDRRWCRRSSPRRSSS